MPEEAASLADYLDRVPVIPVLTIHALDQAVPLARALVEGGLDVLEITLRSDVALEAMRRIAQEVPGAIVGAGTVTRPADLDAVLEVGGKFAVSPGLPAVLAQAATDHELPLLPGIMTPTEALSARDLGFSLLKLFPAEASGGRALLRSLHGPLPDLAFCPTGGIRRETFRDYLALPNVLCVGGSWVAPREAVETGDWQRITDLAREACTETSEEEHL